MVTSETTKAPWLPRLLRDEVIKKVFWALVLAALGGASLLFKNRHDLNIGAVLGYALAVLLALAWLGTSAYNRASYSRPYYPKLRFPYEILEKTITYEIRDDKLYFSRKVKLRALVDNVDTYYDKYLWTAGDAALPKPGVGCQETGQMYRVGIWTFYTTTLSQSLRRGDVHDFEAHWPAIDDWRSSRPFVSTSTEEPCRSLTFVVLIPAAALHSDVVYMEEMRGIEAAHPFVTNRGKFERGKFEWTVKAKLYRHYRVRWSWAGQGEVVAIPQVEETGDGA